MDIVSLPAALIYPNSEARPLDLAKIDGLVESIREVGLLNAIIVRKAMKIRNGVKADAWEIIAGPHRYEACARLRMDEIPCAVADTTDLLAELMMIDENLCRANLSPAEEAYQTARRKEIYEALHPEAKAEAFKGNQYTGKVAGDKLSFATQTADATGRDRRTVERDAARGHAIGEDLKRIAGTSLDRGVELDALAKLSPQDREDLVARAEKGERVSARKPVKIADDPLNDFEAREKQVARLMTAWNAASPEAREEFMCRIDRPIFDGTKTGRGG